MKGILGIVKKRSTPGVLIFDLKDRLLYSNREPFEMVPEFQTISKRGKGKMIRNKISNICKQLKEKGKKGGNVIGKNFTYAVLNRDSGDKFSMQAFFIGGIKDKKPTHIMVLIQKIIRKHDINFEKIKETFALSARELEVLKPLCEGFTNKEISDKLFISEYTVKDHMKKILRKMGVSSRNQIISSLK